MDSFSESYVQARGKFLAAANDAGARVHSYGRDDLTGIDGERLVCDVAVLGPEEAAGAAIVICGTHGAEGYCASAIQHRWLANRRNDASDAIKIVLVHAINPWSFSHKTRTTENNVDLNRNFFADAAGYELNNASYDRLAPFLHAKSVDPVASLTAYSAYKKFLDENGLHIEGESWTGQSDHPDGIFYTGKGPEWSNDIFRRIVKEHLGRAERIGFIDWHTCIGAFGEVVYLVFDQDGSSERAEAMGWWGLDKGSDGAFKAGSVPKYDGLLCKAIRQELARPKIAGAVIEFGTVDDYALFRADRLDRWLSFEGSRDPDQARLREDYKDVNCPRDVAWRRMVLAEGPRIMDRLIEGVSQWKG